MQEIEREEIMEDEELDVIAPFRPGAENFQRKEHLIDHEQSPRA